MIKVRVVGDISEVDLVEVRDLLGIPEGADLDDLLDADAYAEQVAG